MATIFVDNVPYEVEDGQNLLHACLSVKLDLPYFCWHPAMHSVGACRQCAVKQYRDANDTKGRIVMACMTPAMDGTRISIADPEAKAFRASVIEWLMESHPHDCPVCDEGGECHLQDMTLMTGHSYRRYRFEKRTHRNQYLGPFINHEMNRCIQCYRCVRYYRDVADGRDLNVFASHNYVYFGRDKDGVLENEFSGNLVEVCPTGVFTDKSFKRHYTRKWDLRTAPSICVNCAVGCNTIPGERYDELRRIRNRFHYEVNGYFLCDRGRYGYDFVNSELRIREPLLRRPGGSVSPSTAEAPLLPAGTKDAALEHVARLLTASKGIIGIGSPRASLEANFALRTMVGPDNFYLGISRAESRLLPAIVEILRGGPAPSASMRDVRESDAVLILGEDVTNVAPVLALAIREAARNQPRKAATKLRIPEWDAAAIKELVQDAKGPVFIASAAGTKLDDIAEATYRAAPDDVARLGFAIAEALRIVPREGGGLLERAKSAAERVTGALGGDSTSREVRDLAERIAQALRSAEKPLVVAGTSYGNEAIVQAAANVAWSLRESGRPASLSFTVPESNTMGLALMGGGDLHAAFEAVAEGRADTVVLLENDLYRRADAADVDAFFNMARHVVAIDYLANQSNQKAEVVLPAGTFAESDGTLVNNEGRAQRFYQVFVPLGHVQESWRWLRDAMAASGRVDVQEWRELDDLIAAMVADLPGLAPVAEIAPPATFRIAGLKIARQHQRASGRTAMAAHIDVSEPAPPEDPDAPFTFSMEGYHGYPGHEPAPLIPRFWAPGWNSEQALNKFQEEVGGPLKGDSPGRRLIEASPTPGLPYFEGMPVAFVPREGEVLIVPLHHIFGSEELSMHSPGVVELSPSAYLGLNPEDARGLGLTDGQEIELPLGGALRRIVVRPVAELPRGVAGLPAGLPGLLGIAMPAWSPITVGRS